MTIRRMHIACWIPKATNTCTHTFCLLLIAFPPQQRLHERTSVLWYRYIAHFFVLATVWGYQCGATRISQSCGNAREADRRWQKLPEAATEVSSLSLKSHYLVLRTQKFDSILPQLGGPGSVVAIATGYWLNGPGIESPWGRDFPHLSRPSLGLTQPAVQCLPGLSRG